MFFIDLEGNYVSRFDLGKLIYYDEDAEVFDILSSYFVYKIHDLPSVGTFTVSTEEYRPDLISWKLYDNTKYWWIIMEYNSIIDVGEIVADLVLNYPSIKDVETIYMSLAGKKQQQDRGSIVNGYTI